MLHRRSLVMAEGVGAMLLLSLGFSALSGIAYWLYPVSLVLGLGAAAFFINARIWRPFSRDLNGNIVAAVSQEEQEARTARAKEAIAVVGPIVLLLALLTSLGNPSVQDYGLLVCGNLLGFAAGFFGAYTIWVYLLERSAS